MMRKFIVFVLAASFSVVVWAAQAAKPYINPLVAETITERVDDSRQLRLIRLNSELRLTTKTSPRPPLLVLELYANAIDRLLGQSRMEKTLLLSDGERLSLERVSAVSLESFQLNNNTISLRIAYSPLVEAGFDIDCHYAILANGFSAPDCQRVATHPGVTQKP